MVTLCIFFIFKNHFILKRNPIMCGTTRFSNLPLWYAHYDGSPSFSDFVPFGGWGRPVMKQYQGTTGVCGTSIDLDFY